MIKKILLAILFLAIAGNVFAVGGIITMSIPVLAALAGGYLTNDHFNKKKEAEVKQ